MSNSAYQVDFHLIQIVYFDSNDSLPLCNQYREIWTGLKLFGPDKLYGRFVRPSELPSDGKLHRYPLGDSNAFPLKAERQGSVVIGGGICQKTKASRPTQDCDLYLAMGEASRCRYGSTLPFFQFAVSNPWVNTVGTESMLGLIKRNFEILDASGPSYGFVDLSKPEETFAGCAYTSPWYQKLPLHRFIELGLWTHSTNEKRDEARGVFWGNYFGTRYLDKLGGRDHFIRRFSNAANLKSGDESAIIWEFDNGIFVSLSLDPLGCTPSEPLDVDAQYNAEWLFNDLARCKALLGTL